ncbi:MAG TPA: winged helix-turn-helix domain-containing protein [Blastocatellia bacterium]|jgi:DNA-binding response OmpR family regulator|nr:winged helix-turn-helix domain-containing protein [Blastocatellia bacterium]
MPQKNASKVLKAVTLMLGEERIPEDPSLIASDADSAVYDDGYLRVEHDRFYVSCGGRPLWRLSRREFLILSRLARGAGRPVTKEQIWSFVWGDTTAFNASNFRVHIANLRRKLAPFGLDIIAMVRVGYRLDRSAECEEGDGQV